MKLFFLLSSFVCLAVMVRAQDLTTEAPEVTIDPEAPLEPETTVDPETTIAPENATDPTTAPTSEEPTTTVPSTMTSVVPVETTTASNETTNGNSTDCKDSAPVVCKSFAQLCLAPKRCGGKSKEATKKDDKMNKEKPSRPAAGEDNDGDNGEVVCAWVRMQQLPQLRQIAAKCNQENIPTPSRFLKGGLIGDLIGGLIGGPRGPLPKLPKKAKDSKKQLDCRFQEIASVFFRILCPATCNVC